MSSILSQFRNLMQAKKLSVYILPHSDEHQSEYLCPCDERISIISGFTGSNALAVISKDEALLWTDSRYYLQAQTELHEGWTMRKMEIGQKKWFEYIIENYKHQDIIGVDTRLLSAKMGQMRLKTFKEKGFTIQEFGENLVDELMKETAQSTATPITIHEEWAGKTMSQKVKWVRQSINQKKGNAAIFNDLSEIGWVLNLRSAQIPYNPFFKGVLVLTLQGGCLYLPAKHPSLDSEELRKFLHSENITVEPYEPKFLEKSLITKETLNYFIYSKLVNPIQWDGIDIYRAVRTEKQLKGFRRCHVVDGVAMAKFWAWRSKQESINQYAAAEYLNNRRYEQEHNKGLSFATISGGGANAAIVHYHPTDKVSSEITKEMIHLVDSGGQYLDGTTDVTRTFHFGTPTKEQKDAFTRVLLGNLDVERLQWPGKSEITGGCIDVLARRQLWAKKLDYGHGTGHGVGYYQGVHEGPCGISKYNKTVFKPGMIVTNQPGYYEEGKFGIRIQNMLVVVDHEGFYGFENLTLCPYDKNLLSEELLTQVDRDYINKYHQRVMEELGPRLEGDTNTIDWLKQATAPI